MVNKILLVSLKNKLRRHTRVQKDTTRFRKKLTYHDHILRSQRAAKCRYAKIVPIQAFEEEDNFLYSCEFNSNIQRTFTKDDLEGIYKFFKSDDHKSLLKQLAMSIVKLQPNTVIPECKVKKMEDETKAKVKNKKDEVVQQMYRLMKKLVKERRKLAKENDKNTKIVMEKFHTAVKLRDKSAANRTDYSAKPSNVSMFESLRSTDGLKAMGTEERNSVDVYHKHRTPLSLFRYKNKINSIRHSTNARFGVANVKHCETVAHMVSSRLLGEIETKLPSVQLFIQRQQKTLTSHQRLVIEWSEDCLKAFFFPYDIPGTVCASFVEDTREYVFRSLFNGSHRATALAGRGYQYETFTATAVLAVVSELSPLIKHKNLCLLDTLALIAGVERDALAVVVVKDSSCFQRPHSIAFT